VFRWLKFLMRRDATAAAVVQIDWEKYAQANPAARSLGRFAAVLAARTGGLGTGIRQQLDQAPPAQHAQLLLAYLRGLIASILGADEASLDDHSPLSSLGLDSLMAFEFKVKIDRDLDMAFPVDQLASGLRLVDLPRLVLAQLETTAAPLAPAAPTRTRRASPAKSPVRGEGDFIRIALQSASSQELASLRFDAAALTYLPDKMHTVGGLSDEQMRGMFGREPFLSNYFELPFGRIGVFMLPVRSPALFREEEVPGLILQALEMAESHGAACVSLTGLIPSATDYGLTIESWRGGRQNSSVLTTGHATTTAAVVLNLDAMLQRAGRPLERERLAVLGLGSIGQSCLRLLLEVLPHPRELILADLFTREDTLEDFARVVSEEHGFQGPVRIVRSRGGVPDEVYSADTILAAVSVPEILEVDKLRPGTILVDDSYPPAFALPRAIQRAEAAGDIFFSNAGMVRLSGRVEETLIIPAGAEAVLEQFGVEAFHEEFIRDAQELTGCVLSSLLTARFGFTPTLGLAGIKDLVSHYRGLQEMGFTAARPQCNNYFLPADVIERFCLLQSAPLGR
jgi:acyl carrier protein